MIDHNCATDNVVIISYIAHYLIFLFAECYACYSMETTGSNNGIFYLSWMEQRDALNRVRIYYVCKPCNYVIFYPQDNDSQIENSLDCQQLGPVVLFLFLHSVC